MQPKLHMLMEFDGLVLSREHPELASTLKRLCKEGSLVRLQPGVFADPLRVTPMLRLLALSRSVPHGVLHGRTAVALWLEEPVGVPLELAVPSRIGPRRGVAVTIRRIPPDEVKRFNGVAVASPAYCAAELAATDDGHVATRMLRERVISVEALVLAGRCLTGTSGNGRRRRVLRALAANPWSHAERVLHEVLRAAGIGGWVANRGLWLEGRWVIPDILFEEQQLILEVDGYAHHGSVDAWQRDLERQNILVSGGYRVFRFTWDNLTNQPSKVVRRVRRALS